MHVLLDLLGLIFGLALLVGGGEALVRGASALARRLGVSALAIGLTVVAFGTSAPELAVNLGAAFSDSGSLAFGNVFGSNMANIGLIVGLVAVLTPLPIQNVVVRRELPMMLLATGAAAAMAFDVDLGGTRDAFSRSDGLVFLLFFVVFLYYTIAELLEQRRAGYRAEMLDLARIEDRLPDAGKSLALDVARTVLGLVGLIAGARFTVSGAVGLARLLEVPEVVIGLTVVSVGTSLPELVSALVAVRHRQVDMAVGSVVGSNIFNTLMICGLTAVVRPMPIPRGGHLDLAFTGFLSLCLLLVARTHGQRIQRYEGGLLLAAYCGYVVWRALSAEF